MTKNEILRKTASAIRELVEDKERIEKNYELYKDCIKLAFDMAQQGQIEKDFNSIESKANELFDNKDELSVIKKAMKMVTSYDFVGSLEKKASDKSEQTSEDEALDALAAVLEGY